MSFDHFFVQTIVVTFFQVLCWIQAVRFSSTRTPESKKGMCLICRKFKQKKSLIVCLLSRYFHSFLASFRRPFCLVNQVHAEYSAYVDICVQFICPISQTIWGVYPRCCWLRARLKKKYLYQSNLFIIIVYRISLLWCSDIALLQAVTVCIMNDSNNCVVSPLRNVQCVSNMSVGIILCADCQKLLMIFSW